MEIVIRDGKKVLTYVDDSDLQQGCLIIPEGVQLIGERAFRNCKGLTQITLPNSLTSIGEAAFFDCTGLTQITLPNSITSIGGGAFAGCLSLIQITLPNGLARIEAGTFSGCTSLAQVTLPSSLTYIGLYAFSGCSQLRQITLPRNLRLAGNPFFGCTSFTEIIVDVNNVWQYRDLRLMLSPCNVSSPSIQAHLKKIKALQIEIVMQFSTACPEKILDKISHKHKGSAIEILDASIKANITSYLATPELTQLKEAVDIIPIPVQPFDKQQMATYEAALQEKLIIQVARHTAKQLQKYVNIINEQINRIQDEHFFSARFSASTWNSVPVRQRPTNLTYTILQKLIAALYEGKIPTLTDNEKQALQKPALLKRIPPIIKNILGLLPPEGHKKALVKTMFNSTKNTSAIDQGSLVPIAACPDVLFIENYFNRS